MPRYEFVCLKCQHRFEIVASVNDKRPTKCPECKGELVQDYSTIGVNTTTSTADIRKKIAKQVRRDVAAINRGDEKVIADYGGDKVKKDVNSKVKYMKDVNKGIKRK